MNLNELNKCEQQATNAMQKSKQRINKAKEHCQMTTKHYSRTLMMIAMIQYSNEI